MQITEYYEVPYESGFSSGTKICKTFKEALIEAKTARGLIFFTTSILIVENNKVIDQTNLKD